LLGCRIRWVVQVIYYTLFNAIIKVAKSAVFAFIPDMDLGLDQHSLDDGVAFLAFNFAGVSERSALF
jgi:hypothetical protein